MDNIINILCIGDVVGKNGVDHMRKSIQTLKKNYKIDLVIVNGENASDQNGIGADDVNAILSGGADVITTGNHAFRKTNSCELFENNSNLLRPSNHYVDWGKGYCTIDLPPIDVTVINLQGTISLPNLQNPFLHIDKLLEKINSKIIIIDFHAEATSEKRAMGFYLDGKITALFGTHTHVQTNDAQILPNGTAYITDVGMTGPKNSILGMDVHTAIHSLKNCLPLRQKISAGICQMDCILLEIEKSSGKCREIMSLNV